MSLAFGVGTGPEFIGGLSVPRIWAPRKRRGAAVFWARMSSLVHLLDRPAASHRQSTVTHSGSAQVEKSIRRDFGGIADVVGLTEDDRVVLVGANRELSRVILALEILRASLELFGEPGAWLRSESPDKPFDGGSPLKFMAASGRLGVEITLLYLRARLRLAPRGDFVPSCSDS